MENFDFRKLADQEKFHALPDKEKDLLINTSHEEALSEDEIREKIIEAQRKGLLAEIVSDEFKVVDGQRLRKIYDGYTVRQYFSHSTREAGPGPGWDMFVANAEKIFREYGLNPDKMRVRDLIPEKLPDELHYFWEPVPSEPEVEAETVEEKKSDPVVPESMAKREKIEELKSDPVVLQLERWKPKSPEEHLGLSVVDALQKNGHQAFFVGGYTRDLLMHQFHHVPFHPHDVDVATGASYEEIKKIMQDSGLKLLEIGSQYGILKAIREEIGQNGEVVKSDVEIATFRTEGEYEKGRRPVAEQIQFVEDPRQDVVRRDFTVNALLFDPAKSQVIDYVWGVEDIRNQSLRFVGNQEERINEDKLRMLRYVRFLTRFGFQFSKEVQMNIRGHAGEISQVSSERIQEELEKMLQHPRFWSSINNLFRVGLLPHILPELAALFKLKQPSEHHAEGDAYRHTLEMLRSFPREKFMTEAGHVLGEVRNYPELAKKFPSLIWAGLFHDLGKAQTQGEKIDKEGKKKITFYGHEEKSEELASEICRRLKFSNKEREDIQWLIGRHMTVINFSGMKLSNQKKLMLDQRFPLLMLLHLGDSMSSFPSDTEEYHKMKKIYLEFIHSDEYKRITEGGKDKPVILLISGEDLKILGLKPGPLFRQILADVEEKHLEGEIDNREKALEYVRSKYAGQIK